MKDRLRQPTRQCKQDTTEHNGSRGRQSESQLHGASKKLWTVIGPVYCDETREGGLETTQGQQGENGKESKRLRVQPHVRYVEEAGKHQCHHKAQCLAKALTGQVQAATPCNTGEILFVAVARRPSAVCLLAARALHRVTITSRGKGRSVS